MYTLLLPEYTAGWSQIHTGWSGQRDELINSNMAVAGCTRCIKYMLFFLNFIFWVSWLNSFKLSFLLLFFQLLFYSLCLTSLTLLGWELNEQKKNLMVSQGEDAQFPCCNMQISLWKASSTDRGDTHHTMALKHHFIAPRYLHGLSPVWGGSGKHMEQDVMDWVNYSVIKRTKLPSLLHSQILGSKLLYFSILRRVVRVNNKKRVKKPTLNISQYVVKKLDINVEVSGGGNILPFLCLNCVTTSFKFFAKKKKIWKTLDGNILIKEAHPLAFLFEDHAVFCYILNMLTPRLPKSKLITCSQITIGFLMSSRLFLDNHHGTISWTRHTWRSVSSVGLAAVPVIGKTLRTLFLVLHMLRIQLPVSWRTMDDSHVTKCADVDINTGIVYCSLSMNNNTTFDTIFQLLLPSQPQDYGAVVLKIEWESVINIHGSCSSLLHKLISEDMVLQVIWRPGCEVTASGHC